MTELFQPFGLIKHTKILNKNKGLITAYFEGVYSGFRLNESISIVYDLKNKFWLLKIADKTEMKIDEETILKPFTLSAQNEIWSITILKIFHPKQLTGVSNEGVDTIDLIMTRTY